MEIAGPVIVREVWAHNLEKEFALIRVALPGCRIAAIDTEFPGHIFKSQVDGHLIARLPPAETYELMKSNIDALEIIQVGLALSDSCGRLPHFGTPFSYKRFFGFCIYDVKHMIKSCDGLYGGLERVAKSLNVDRIAGKSHQAGSDSLLTLQTFFKLIGSRKPFTDNTEGN
ncbi:hypothetical protein CRG98_025510 [Punica granatum]|uniref:poly(A)-specific ribonuclease n=1 Tax=Punica granatum TaxID=22663 RepID=A0A2I0JCW2_PUNGR|nr:hypothetical protein CRG98_025510 [Punica granatum]